MYNNKKNGRNCVATSAQMIEDITNEISNAMTLAIGSDKKVNILNGKFSVSWYENNYGYSLYTYTFVVESNYSNWSEETTIDVDKWNELAEEAQEDIAGGLANSVMSEMLYEGISVELDSEEMYKYVESKVKECLEIFKSQPVTDDMVNNFNEVSSALYDMEWEETDEFYDDCINELLDNFYDFTENLISLNSCYNKIYNDFED